MTIVSSFFDREPKYRILLNAFLQSANFYMPHSKMEIVSVVLPGHGYNHDRINNHHWDTYYAFMAKISKTMEIDDNVLMSDNDILFTDTISDVWCKDFDIAITTRNHDCKYNTGICFVKPTEAAKEFLRIWKKKTKEVATKFDKEVIRRWWGIDQASLHFTLQENLRANVIELPCNIWNAEQTSWKDMTEETKIIHIKSGLRRIIFGQEKLNHKHKYLIPIIERIKQYENTRECTEVY